MFEWMITFRCPSLVLLRQWWCAIDWHKVAEALSPDWRYYNGEDIL